MSREIRLLTPLDVFERFHKLADGRRRTVELDRDQLSQLLVDHSTLIAALKSRGVAVLDPPPTRTRRAITGGEK